MNKTSDTLEAIELDFVMYGVVTSREGVLGEVYTWLNSGGIAVTDVAVIELHGPAGGNPLVRIEGTAEAINQVTRLYNQ